MCLKLYNIVILYIRFLESQHLSTVWLDFSWTYLIPVAFAYYKFKVLVETMVTLVLFITGSLYGLLRGKTTLTALQESEIKNI